MKKFLILGLIPLLLMVPSTVFSETYNDPYFGFSIYHPDGWRTNEIDDGSENMVSFSHTQGNAFLYVALDKSPPVSTSLSGNSYLSEMKNHFENLYKSQNNFKFLDDDITSSNGKTAYMVYISFQTPNSASTTITRHIEIPENGQTWRISNQYNTNNNNGEISYQTLLSSFKKIPITETQRQIGLSTDEFYQGFDNFIIEKKNDWKLREPGMGYLLVYTTGEWKGIAWFDKMMMMGKQIAIGSAGSSVQPFACASDSAKIYDTDIKIKRDLPFEFSINSNEPVGIVVMKDGNLITKKNSSLKGSVTISGTCGAEPVEEFFRDLPRNIPKPSGGGCLIATATFDSELAPQVQKLREIRDSKLLQTESGTLFMTGFNDFYYSFSPIIADYERENPVFKEMVKMGVTPLLTTLSLMDYAESESEVLTIGISLIFLNGLMYVGIPVIGIIVIRRF